MTAACIGPLKNILQNTIENLLLAEKEIEGKVGHHTDEGFHLEKFWADINTVAKKLSFDCTKICICFGKSPAPTTNETSSLLTCVEQAVLCLVSSYHKLPLTLGITLHTHVQNEIVKAIQAVKNLVKAIKDEGGAAVYRYSTGVVWEGCRHLENAQLDNKSASLLGMKAHSTMVADAFREISEELDELYEESGLITSQVDVLVQDLYPPLAVSSMQEQSHQLADRLHTVLKTCVRSHVIGEAEEANIEFIQKAIDHNLDCMKEKLSKK
ncbi:Cyclin-D1-binding protein 1 [Chionoecetes opilio]|uniref:Cyclin-D1-binding protein 1 n=1 Tax=Chionoecetes opilio TaxID=41210 RepID=A0A8J4XKT4_CHIOP|nr:Cyclin-D1-binding protein 1 [Chionoecetes opilio]